MQQVWVSWSSGKDSAWMLHRLLQEPHTSVTGLLTTVNTTHQRVAMHGTRWSILEAQAKAVGLPLHVVPLPWPCSNEVYEDRMKRVVVSAREQGVTHLAFGDLFLEDIRDYRVRLLKGSGVSPLFPLWGEPTNRLAREMAGGGLKAVLTCVDPQKLSPAFAGRTFDRDLLEALPETVDWCGENGEFHTCVVDGPMFRHPLPVRTGERVDREGFCFADLMLSAPCDGCGTP